MTRRALSGYKLSGKAEEVQKPSVRPDLHGTADVDPEFGAKGVVFDDLLSELQGGSA